MKTVVLKDGSVLTVTSRHAEILIRQGKAEEVQNEVQKQVPEEKTEIITKEEKIIPKSKGGRPKSKK